MERKGGSSTAVLTAEQVKSALNRTRALTSEEEKSVRMRHGVGVKDLTTALPRAAGGNAGLEDELLLIEMQLLRAFRAKTGASRPQVSRAAAEPVSAAKSKIIRALRKK
jgi:hypothetical protein